MSLGTAVKIVEAVEEALVDLDLIAPSLSATQKDALFFRVKSALEKDRRKAELDKAMSGVIDAVWYHEEYAHIVDLARQLAEYPEPSTPEDVIADAARRQFFALYLTYLPEEFSSLIPAGLDVYGEDILDAVMAAVAEEKSA